MENQPVRPTTPQTSTPQPSPPETSSAPQPATVNTPNQFQPPIPQQPNPMTKSSQAQTPPRSPNKSKLIIISLIGIVSLTGIIGYLVFINSMNDKSGVDTKPDSPTRITSQPPSFAPTKPDSSTTTITKEQLNQKLSNLTSASDFEFTDTIVGTISEGCTTTSKYRGIVQESNRYALHESHFTPESIQYCQVDLKEIYLETYWIGEQTIYRQYSDREFQIKNPDSNVVTAKEPFDYLSELLPQQNSINIISAENPNLISFSGLTTNGISVTYKAELSDKNTISKLDYDLFMESQGISIKGSILFGTPNETITPPSVSQN